VQQPLVSVSTCLQRALNPAKHILNKVLDSDIALLASFVTAVDNSSSYETTSQQLSFYFFVKFAVVS